MVILISNRNQPQWQCHTIPSATYAFQFYCNDPYFTFEQSDSESTNDSKPKHDDWIYMAFYLMFFSSFNTQMYYIQDRKYRIDAPSIDGLNRSFCWFFVCVLPSFFASNTRYIWTGMWLSLQSRQSTTNPQLFFPCWSLSLSISMVGSNGNIEKGVITCWWRKPERRKG